jgi:hypothetical protein
VEVLPSDAVHTRRNSWATPIAATPDRPVPAWRARCGCITSSLGWSFSNLIHGLSLASEKESTALRKRSPICRNSAGEGNGNPRYPERNATTWELVCKIGT